MIGPANNADAAAIAGLLREAGLPHEDFWSHLRHFLVARRGSAVVGAVGAELCGSDALLRSLVVLPDLRGAGLGGRLVDGIERAAEAWGVRRWWLLTTTAEEFFLRRGFAKAERSAAPESIRSTGQFCGGCCSAAICLVLERKGLK
jgi:amino-acid N-acetyltransferase